MMIHPKLVMFHGYVKSPCFNSHTWGCTPFQTRPGWEVSPQGVDYVGGRLGAALWSLQLQPVGDVACYWDRPIRHHTAEVPFHHEGLGATRLSFFGNPSGSRDLPDETHLFPLHKSMKTKDPNTCF